MNNKKQSVISLGIVSLVTVFAVLLLTSFSILILSNSSQDNNLSQKTAQAITDYYSADSSAEVIISEVDMIRQSNNFADKQQLSDAISSEGYNIYNGTEYENYNGAVILIEQPIDENKYLSVIVGFGIDKNTVVERFVWQTVANN